MGDKFDRFVKRTLRMRLAIGLEVDGDRYSVEYREEPMVCDRSKKRKESDGYLLITKVLAEEYREFAKIPVEIKTGRTMSAIIKDLESLVPCGLLTVMTVDDPREVKELSKLREKLEGKADGMPVRIVAYPKKFVTLVAYLFDDERLPLAERIFLSMWNYDLISYDMVISAKGRMEGEILGPIVGPGGGEESTSVAVAKAVVESLEMVKSRKNLDTLKKAVRSALKKANVSVDQEVLDEMVEGFLRKLSSHGMVEMGTVRSRGRLVPAIYKRKWDKERALEALISG